MPEPTNTDPRPCFSFNGWKVQPGRFPYRTRCRWHRDWEVGEVKWKVASEDAPFFLGETAFCNVHFSDPHVYPIPKVGEQIPSFHQRIDDTPVPFLDHVTGTADDFAGRSINQPSCFPAPPPPPVITTAAKIGMNNMAEPQHVTLGRSLTKVGIKSSALKRYIRQSSSTMGLNGISRKIAPTARVTEARIGVFSTSVFAADEYAPLDLSLMINLRPSLYRTSKSHFRIIL